MPTLRYDNGVMRLNKYVLFKVLPFDHVLVIKGKTGLTAIRVNAQNVDRLVLGEIATATSQGNSVEDGCWVGQRIGSRLCDSAQYVELFTVDLFDDHRNLRFGEIGLQFASDIRFEFQWSETGRLHLSNQRQRYSSI